MLLKELKYQLKLALSLPKPGEKSFLRMTPPNRQLKISQHDQPVKKSSVLILLYPTNINLSCILIKRPGTMKHHAGQIAFPGGMIENSDKNPLAAALREANEEIGIIAEKIEILGELTNLYVSASNFLISPFIGWHDDEPELIQNVLEVDKIIRFPISDFLDGTKITYTILETSMEKLSVPCFRFEGEIIWGATAMILSELVDILKKLIP